MSNPIVTVVEQVTNVIVEPLAPSVSGPLTAIAEQQVNVTVEPPPATEVIIALPGVQGNPGVVVSDTPPADHSLIWVDTSAT